MRRAKSGTCTLGQNQGDTEAQVAVAEVRRIKGEMEAVIKRVGFQGDFLAFVEFLRRTETDVSRRMLWFAFVNRLLEMTRGPFRTEVLTAMEESHQPVLSLYARLERMAPERRP